MAEELFRRPLGLFLQGGGALGAWQAAALEVFATEGLRFDAIMGYSIGAVNGAALAFDRLPEALSHWRAMNGRALRPRPRWNPPSLCSPRPLRAFLDEARDDRAARAALKTELVVISACPADAAPINARFTPEGKDGWDGPLVEHVAASCAIPLVFPPVDLEYRGRRLRLIDGGVPMRRPPDFAPLARCLDLIVLEMVRADEMGRRVFLPWNALDQGGREAGRGIVDDGLEGLLQAPRPPRVFRLPPSRRLPQNMLDFRARGLRELMAQGVADARDFLAAPERRRTF